MNETHAVNIKEGQTNWCDTVNLHGNHNKIKWVMISIYNREYLFYVNLY